MLPIMQNITPVINVTYRYRHHETGITCIIGYMGNRYQLHCSQSETVHAFHYGIGIYVLNINKSKGYIGFNSYMGKEHHSLNSVYLHDSQEIQEKLGDHWKSMDPTMLAAVLFDCLY